MVFDIMSQPFQLTNLERIFHFGCFDKIELMLDLSRLYLHEATLRMMAGASPNKTQQLLDKSTSLETQKVRGLVCVRDREVYTGQREHAMALMLACKHLPSQLHSSSAETTGRHNRTERELV